MTRFVSVDATALAADSGDALETPPAAPDPNHFVQSDAVEVRRVVNRGKGGRAVVARRDIAEGELIERVPVLMIPRTQVFGPGDVAQRAARISWYVFEWLPTKRPYVVLSLGYGSIYNHSDDPNAAYDMEPPDIMLFTAIKPIRAGEEVLISYAGAAGVMKELGFEIEKAPPLAADAGSVAGGGANGDEHR
jgi:hypothetical protein